MARKWCLNCNQYVEAKKPFHGIAFTLLIIFVWLPALFFFGGAGILFGIFEPALGGFFILVAVIIFFSPFCYILYHVFGKKGRCPICNGINFRETK